MKEASESFENRPCSKQKNQYEINFKVVKRNSVRERDQYPQKLEYRLTSTGYAKFREIVQQYLKTNFGVKN